MISWKHESMERIYADNLGLSLLQSKLKLKSDNPDNHFSITIQDGPSPRGLGLVEFDLGSYLAGGAASVATYCPAQAGWWQGGAIRRFFSRQHGF